MPGPVLKINELLRGSLKRYLVKRLEQLGHKVTLEPLATA
jgi:hypothetical protein